MYPSILPHVAHMKPKPHSPSFFMSDEIKLVRYSRLLTVYIMKPHMFDNTYLYIIFLSCFLGIDEEPFI